MDSVIDALAAFVQKFVIGGQVIRGQTNRVSMPKVPFAVLTEILQVDISIPRAENLSTEQKTKLHSPKRIDVQIDFYGPLAGDYCSAFKSSFRSEWGVLQFPSNIKPLYESEGHQAPLINSEEQYESRWTITASLQYNPTLTVPQQSATEASVNILETSDT